MILRRDHRVGAGTVGHPQAGAQVVRIGHAVEDQQERRLPQGVEQVVQRTRRRQRLDAGDHALVAAAAGQARQAQAVRLDRAQARFLGLLQELPHAGVLAGRVDVELQDGFRCRAQAHPDRMEAEQDFRGRGHRRDYPVWPAVPGAARPGGTAGRRIAFSAGCRRPA